MPLKSISRGGCVDTQIWLKSYFLHIAKFDAKISLVFVAFVQLIWLLYT
jgi:hypothetical protein